MKPKLFNNARHIEIPPPRQLSPIIKSNSPERVWMVSGYNGAGTPIYSSRAWEKGERAQYCRNVLHREPYAGES